MHNGFVANVARDMDALRAAFLLELVKAPYRTISIDKARPALSVKEHSARQWCKRRGLVTYSDRHWVLTAIGFKALKLSEFGRLLEHD